MPSISSGVVAKVVNVKLPESHSWAIQMDKHGEFPAMLETTAAVHPGASGGIVVNSEGHMIGLITRYHPCLYKLQWRVNMWMVLYRKLHLPLLEM